MARPRVLAHLNLREAILRDQPAKLRLPAKFREWVLSNWSPKKITAQIPSASITVKRHKVVDGVSDHFMYVEGNNNPHLVDDHDSTTEYLKMSPASLFENCDLQMNGEKEYLHYYTSPARDAMPNTVDDSWREHMIVNQDFNAQFGVDPFLSMWIGGAGSCTAAHYDVLDNVFVQAHGSKRFKLWPPQSFSSLRVYPDSHPRARKTQWKSDQNINVECPCSFEIDLHAGDALWIPSFYFHQVEALDTSVSLNVFSLCKTNFAASQVLSIPFPTLGDDRFSAELKSSDLGIVSKLFARVLVQFFHQPMMSINFERLGEKPSNFIRTHMLSRFDHPNLAGKNQTCGLSSSISIGSDSLDRDLGERAEARLQILMDHFQSLQRELRAHRDEKEADGVLQIVISHLIEAWSIQLLGDPTQVPQLLLATAQTLQANGK